MANEHECIVCGKPRFLIKGRPQYYHPLICSEKCVGIYLDEEPRPAVMSAEFEQLLTDDLGTVRNIWTLRYNG